MSWQAELVQCGDCFNYLPDQIGDGKGIGQCGAYEAYKAKGPSIKQLETAFIRLGNKLFWGGRSEPNRYCEKYEPR